MLTRVVLVLLAALLPALLLAGGALASAALPKRSELPEEDKWRLEDIYPADELWEKDFAKAKELIAEVAGFKGRLGEGGDTLLACLQASERLGRTLDNVYLYARMRLDEDAKNPTYQEFASRAESLAAEAGSSVSFLSPEILSLPEDRLTRFVAETPGLAQYQFMLEQLNRQRPHTLDTEKEELLAEAAEVANGPSNIFDALRSADLKFPAVKDAEGQEHAVSEGRYGALLESRDRKFRQEVYESLFGTYRKFEHTLAAAYSTSVKKDLFYARVRHYPSALAAALFPDDVPVEVYDNLIATVERHLGPLQRYVALRKKVLGLDKVHPWDMFVPLVAEVDLKVGYPEARRMVLDGLAPLGPGYRQELETAFSSRWIDVYENEGKRSGGYSWGGYDTHPYILLNYDGTIGDVLTVAHELGHAIHRYESNRHQPYTYADYSIFVAEVASTTNEALMMEYLLAKTTDREQRLFLLGKYLENIRGTIYTQTMFAEFEKRAHELAEAGQALSSRTLSKLWADLNRKYFGPDFVVDDVATIGWGRIPHFYRSFYVYKYVTGLSAGTALAQQILKDGQPAVERYFAFLRAGGSDYPLNVLKAAGVDLTSPKPLEDTIGVFERLLAEMEELLK